MSSPFQRAFSGKSPLNKHGKLEKKLKKVKEGKIGSEGQGGIDYELQSQLEEQIKTAKAKHGKQQDNSIVEEERDNSQMDASMANYGVSDKKKTKSVAQMRSPLNGSYESGGRGEIYVSSVGAIQQAVSSVQNAVDSYMNEDPQHKADRIAGRIDSRKNRLYHGEDIMNDDSLTDEEKENKLAEVNQRSYSMKTQELIDRAATSQKEADEFELSEIERLKKENEAYKKKFNI